MSDVTRTIYLDYNATTPLEPEVLETTYEALKKAWGNPSSSYDAVQRLPLGCVLSVQAKHVIDHARKCVARMVNGKPEDIIFTSGGTEANNWVLTTALQHFWESYQGAVDMSRGAEVRQLRPHIVKSNIEHDSIRLVLEQFQKDQKADVTYVPASKASGRVEVSDIIAAIRPTTSLVTVMLANNETGVIQPVGDIAAAVRRLKRNKNYEVSRILLHSDVAQALGKIPVDAQDLDVDYLTIVGHKFYGPRIGALYARSPTVETPVYPLYYGGGQERNLRPGTENTGMIAGLGKAAELVVQGLAKYQNHMAEIRDYFEEQLQVAFGDRVHINGKYKTSQRLPNTCNVSILGGHLVGHKVLAHCKHLQASVGAACHSVSSQRASPVLLAIGIPDSVAVNAIRLSVGRGTTKQDIDTVIADLKQAVDFLTHNNSPSELIQIV